MGWSGVPVIAENLLMDSVTLMTSDALAGRAPASGVSPDVNPDGNDLDRCAGFRDGKHWFHQPCAALPVGSPRLAGSLPSIAATSRARGFAARLGSALGAPEADRT